MKIKLAILAILFLGGFLRFYKLDWGQGFFFHPDEYHIAIAVNRLDFPTNMNPDLFSYGSFTVYLIYFSKLILESINSSLSDINSILIGRFFSAFFSTATILLVFFISKQIFKERRFTLLTTFTTAIAPGLIQQAHFATPESTLIFWLFATITLWVFWLTRNKEKFLFLSAITLGAAAATKIVATAFLPILAIMPLFKNSSYSIKSIFNKFISVIVLLSTCLLVFIAFFPYSLLDKNGFLHSMKYETSVAQGKLVVFYTRQFIDTTPFSFQLTKIFPYTLGPAVLLLGLMGFIFIIFKIIRTLIKERKLEKILIILLLSFLAILLANILLFTKWVRFMAPTFPYFNIFAAFSIYYIYNLKGQLAKPVSLLLTIFVVVFSTLWSLMFFSIYKKTDVRINSTEWINQNITQNSNILTEEGNTLEVPLSGGYNKRVFNFYNLNEPKELDNLSQHLVTADYFIIQSRRVFVNHQRLSKDFPDVSNFYNKLFSGELGFEKVKEFTSFPRLFIGPLKFEIDDEQAEETWSVFDHPVVRIDKKTNLLSEIDYQRLLTN